jgi:hypothetical protein
VLQRVAVLVATSVIGCVGCASAGDGSPAEPPRPASASTSASAAPASCPEPRPPQRQEFDKALHDELVAMLKRDQAGMAGGRGFVVRTERLREILAEHGWPGFDLVGEDGEDAAWAIAQHADHDAEFQRCALALLEVAVANGQGSPGNFAYLGDRVAVASGELQRYGTQVRCGQRGPKPSTPLEDPRRIDEWRAEADLPPYEEYVEEMAAICEDG